MLDADGKRLAALLAGMDATLGRAVVGYLRLFKPAKTALRTVRAVKIVQELDALVRVGSVCQDERGGVRRPTAAATWAAGIEQILAAPPTGLPLTGHGYLRKIVFGLADQADARAERAQHESMRAGHHRVAQKGVSPPVAREDPLQASLAHLKQLFDYGHFNEREYRAKVDAERAKFAHREGATDG